MLGGVRVWEEGLKTREEGGRRRGFDVQRSC